jgi:hypothetical protein
MDLEQAIVCAVVFIVGIIIGIVIEKLRTHKRAPWAGNLVMDYRINAEDHIGIESAYKVSHWHKYKYLTFSVKKVGPDQMKFYDRTEILDKARN